MGRKRMDEEKKRQSERMRNHKVSDETRAKISNSLMGNIPWNKGKTGYSCRGHSCDEETKIKISNTLKGRPSPQKGCRRSEETKKKLSESHMGKHHPHKGHPLSEEHKKRIGEGVKLHNLVEGTYHHTEETKQIMSEHAKTRTGEKAARWQGGITPEIIMLRKSDEYINWRDAVFDRDDYTCQSYTCQQRGGKLHAHHLLGFADYPEYRFYVENGITLCVDCHMKIHGEMRRKAS